MAISFNSIPSNARQPLFYSEVSASNANLYSQNLKTLLFGQTITAQAAVPTFVGSEAKAIELFGLGSMAAIMAKSYFANNTQNELWVVPLADDGSGVKAEIDIQVTEAALTEAKTIYVSISGEVVEVTVGVGATAIGMATAIETAINANVSLPVTATRTTDEVTLSVRNAGVVGNSLPISVSGVEVTQSVGVTGLGDPDINQTIIDAIGDVPYEYWVSPYNDNTRVDTLTGLLDARWLPVSGLYGHLFTAVDDTVSNMKVLGEYSNNEHLTIVGTRNTISSPIETLAAYAGKVAASLSIDPARPVQTLELAGIKAVLPEDQLTYAETNSLLYSGVSPLQYDSKAPAIVRCITAYRLNAFGQPDVSYLDTNTLSTLARVIRGLRIVITSKFKRVKLVSDGTLIGAGSATVSPSVIRNEIISVYDDLIRLGLVEGAEGFEETLVVERSQTDPNRVDVLFTPDLANQLRIVGVKTQFVLQR